MTRFSFSSLRVRLLLLVLLAVIPALGLILYTAAEMRRTASKEAQANALRLAQSVSSAQDDLFEGARQLLTALAQLPEVRKRDSEACNALFASLLKQFPLYVSLGAVDAKGDAFCSAIPITGPINAADRAWFQRAFLYRGFAIGDYQIGRVSGKASLNFGYPVIDDRGDVQAVVLAALDLAWLNRLAAKAQLPEGSVLSMTDQNGIILARHPHPEKWVGKSMQETPIFRAITARREEGTTSAAGVDGVERLYAFTPLHSTAQVGEAYVSVGIPQKVALADAAAILKRNLAGLGIVGLLALMAAWFGADLFVLRRVNDLVSTSKRLSAGDLSARTGLAYGEGELSGLARTFDQMADSLEQREAERKQAEREIQRHVQRITALRDINTAITSTLDLHSILGVLLEKIDLFLPYATATTVRLFDEESRLLEPLASRNIDEQEWRAEPWRGGRGIQRVVFESKAPQTIRNVETDPRIRNLEFYRKHKLVSYLGVPLIVKDKVLGVLSLYTKEEHEFTHEEIEFLSTLAGQAAIAIHNSRLYEETERRRREAEELARMAQSLTETLDMTAVGERIVTSMRELFGVSASTLRLLQPDGSLRTLASSGEGFSLSFGGDVLPAGTGLAGVAVAEGRSIWSADILNEPRIRLTDQMRDYQLRSGNRSMIAVPLRAHERIIGSLGFMDQTGRTYSSSEVALAQTFADQAALALENARLYEEARSREAQLQDSNRMLSALHSVAAAASQSLDLDRILNAAIDKIRDLFHFDSTRIHIYNEQTDELLLRASFENDPARFTAPRSFRRGQGIVGKAGESGKPFIFEDVQSDPLYQQFSQSKIATRLGLRFFAVLPIKGRLKCLGTLSCVGAAPRKLSSGEIQLLEALADQIAVATENSDLYEQTKRQALKLEEANKDLKRREEIQKLLKELSQDITRLDVDSLLKKLTTEIREMLKVDISDVRLFEGGKWFLRGISGIDPSLIPSARTGTAIGRSSWIIKHRKPLVIPDAAQEQNPPSGETTKSLGLRGYVAVPLFSKDGEVIGVLRGLTYQARDFTQEEVDLLQQLANETAIALENARLLEQTKNQAVELEKANEAQADFTAMVAHDLRSPLLNVIGAAGMIQDGLFGSVNEEQKKWLGKIEANSRSLVNLVSNYLDLSKLEAGRIDLAREEVDLEQLIRNNLDNFQLLAQDKKISVRARVAPDLPRIKADPRRLDQVFANLISNAIKFTGEGGEIEVGARHDSGGEAKVWVKDSGVGIPPQEMGSLFEKYRQTTSGRAAKEKGTGLGLVICKMIVEAHGGRIWVESEEGKGTIFSFTLPYGG